MRSTTDPSKLTRQLSSEQVLPDILLGLRRIKDYAMESDEHIDFDYRAMHLCMTMGSIAHRAEMLIRLVEDALGRTPIGS